MDFNSAINAMICDEPFSHFQISLCSFALFYTSMSLSLLNCCWRMRMAACLPYSTSFRAMEMEYPKKI